MIEARRCDECKRLTTRELAEVVVEESVGVAQTMGGSSRMYSKTILRICRACVREIAERSEDAG
jgi:hypothetical protein